MMASGASCASAGEFTPTKGSAATTAVKRKAFRRLRVMFIVCSCGSDTLPRVRQSGRTLTVTKVAEGNAKERTKFVAVGTGEVSGPQRPRSRRHRGQRIHRAMCHACPIGTLEGTSAPPGLPPLGRVHFRVG